MARWVAECADVTPPEPGSAFESCAAVVWEQEKTLADLFPDWTASDYGTVTSALIVVAAVVWLIRKLEDAAT